MSEGKSSLAETILKAFAQQTMGAAAKYVERMVKRTLRLAGLYTTGLAFAIIGLIFLGIGFVRWLTLLVPSWLAWIVVGMIMSLIGVVIVLASSLASRN